MLTSWMHVQNLNISTLKVHFAERHHEKVPALCCSGCPQNAWDEPARNELRMPITFPSHETSTHNKLFDNNNLFNHN